MSLVGLRLARRTPFDACANLIGDVLHTFDLDLARFEWVGMLLARFSVGLLFLISGGGKLWRADKRTAMRKTLESAHVPAPKLMAPVVSGVEFVFGGLLLLGALTSIACAMLSANMVVAIVTTRVHDVKATSIVDWLADFLYLPEVLYLVILVWLFFSGPGRLSVDHALR